MRIFVTVKANTNKNFVQQLDATHYVIATTEPPVQGRANIRIIKLLSDHLKLPKSFFTIKRGSNSKQKTIEIAINQLLIS